VQGVKGVREIHHLHVWELDEGFHIVTAHVVVEDGEETVVLKQQIRQRLIELGHCEVTLEFERVGEECLDPEHPSGF
jgi:cobalt-zinc-cadmium efflux system protein